METGELLSRIETALSPQPSPSLEEVLAEIGRRGVVTGGLNRVLQGYKIYVSYVAEKMAELAQQHGKQLREVSSRLFEVLKEAEFAAEDLLKALAERIRKGDPPGDDVRVWQYEGRWFYFLKLRGVRVSFHFPNVLSTALRELEPFQIGWRASDETVVRGMAAMGTTQMWQVFAWLAVRPGDVHIEIKGLNLTKRGISPMFFVTSVNWRQRLGKIEAIRHTIEAFKQGEYRPLLTWWLGDGSVKWSFVEKRHYKLRIALAKELKHELSQMLPSYVEAGENYIYISGGKKLFVELVKAAGIYGKLLDVL
ncbi:MAG: hypothetical protein ACP5H5_08605, partial [Pyrobaculum sp.]